VGSLHPDSAAPSQLAPVAPELPETGPKVFKACRVNSLLNKQTVPIKVSIKPCLQLFQNGFAQSRWRARNGVGTVVITPVLRRHSWLLHAHLKHDLQSLFNAHQHIRNVQKTCRCGTAGYGLAGMVALG